MNEELPPQGTCQETGPSAVIDEIGCALSTIIGMTKSNEQRELQNIKWTALACLERLKLLLPAEPHFCPYIGGTKSCQREDCRNKTTARCAWAEERITATGRSDG